MKIEGMHGTSGRLLAAAGLILAAIQLASPAGAQVLPAPADAARLEQDVRFLAADEREGRGPGSAGLADALRYVAQRFADLGLTPPMAEGPQAGGELDAYYQHFTVAGYPLTANVIGILPGRRQQSATGQPAISPRAVIVAAHVDHLGRDAELSGDQIYNGADDNASGVAAMLEIARLLAARGDNERAIVFIAFSAEEAGLLGSRYYTEHPIIPHEEVLAMINLDSIGRLRDDRVIVFGQDSAQEFAAILAGLNQSRGLDVATGARGVEGSDHTSFIAAGVPALHFFTGAHEDFSKVTDSADLVHYDGLARLTDYLTELTRYLGYRSGPLNFVAPRVASAGPQPGGGGHPGAGTGQRGVSLGFMPDFAGGVAGVKIAQITPGGAAEAAGIQAGDVITAIDGEAVPSLQDYTAILRMHAPGDEVTVTLLREGRELEVPATLQERR